MKQPMSLDKDISYDTEAGPRINTRLAGLAQVNTPLSLVNTYLIILSC